MALINFGKQEIDELNLENERLREEVADFESRCNTFEKDMKKRI